MNQIKLIILIWVVFLLSGCKTLNPQQDDWFGRDKLYHFGISSLVSAGITKNALDNGHGNSLAANRGIGITMTFGAGKELRDKYYKKTFWSWKDMFWNLLGSYVGSELGEEM